MNKASPEGTKNQARPLTSAFCARSVSGALAQSSAGIGVPIKGAQSAARPKLGAFFMPVFRPGDARPASSWRAVRGSRKARLFLCRYANRASSATLRMASQAADSKSKGVQA